MSFRFPHKMFEKQTALFTDFEDFEQKNSYFGATA